jgi:transcriptional regulator with XRE-family HTH domain
MEFQEKDLLDLEAIVASGLRALREKRGWTQDELARRLRDIGLPWNRSVVAAVEFQTRRIGLGELIAVLGIFGISLRQLLDDAPPTVALGSGPLIVRTALLEILTGTGSVTGFELHRGGGGRPAREDVAAVLDAQGDVGSEEWRRLLDLLEDLSSGDADGKGSASRVSIPPELAEALPFLEEEAAGEFEQYAAKRLGTTSLVVAFLSSRLWGRSATDERNRRAPEGPSHRASREIVEELQAALSGRPLAGNKPAARGLSSETIRWDERIAELGRIPAPSSRYLPIFQWLKSHPGDRITASFSTLEEILGRALPPSARRHRAWWANDTTHSHARGWLAAGWLVESADVLDEIVAFRRADGGSQ